MPLPKQINLLVKDFKEIDFEVNLYKEVGGKEILSYTLRLSQEEMEYLICDIADAWGVDISNVAPDL